MLIFSHRNITMPTVKSKKKKPKKEVNDGEEQGEGEVRVKGWKEDASHLS